MDRSPDPRCTWNPNAGLVLLPPNGGVRRKKAKQSEAANQQRTKTIRSVQKSVGSKGAFNVLRIYNINMQIQEDKALLPNVRAVASFSLEGKF